MFHTTGISECFVCGGKDLPPDHRHGYDDMAIFYRGQIAERKVKYQEITPDYRQALLNLTKQQLVAEIEKVRDMLGRASYMRETERDAALAEIKRLMDGMEFAWCIIANAHGGNWEEAREEWFDAAVQWRDGFWHPALKRNLPQEGKR